MKKHFFLFLISFLCFSFHSKAQVPLPVPTVVIDVNAARINTTGWAESLAKSTTQVTTLIESKNLLTQSIEIYSKVSSTITSLETITQMINTQVTLVSLAGTELTRMNYLSAPAYGHYVQLIQEIIGENKSNIILLQKIISPYVKMTDADRLNLIRELNKESRSQLSQFFAERNRFNEFNNNLEILNSLKSKK